MPELLVGGIIFVVLTYVSAKLLVAYITERRLTRARENYKKHVENKYELQNIYDEFGKGDDGDRNPLVQYHDDNHYVQ